MKDNDIAQNAWNTADEGDTGGQQCTESNRAGMRSLQVEKDQV